MAKTFRNVGNVETKKSDGDGQMRGMILRIKETWEFHENQVFQ